MLHLRLLQRLVLLVWYVKKRHISFLKQLLGGYAAVKSLTEDQEIIQVLNPWNLEVVMCLCLLTWKLFNISVINLKVKVSSVGSAIMHNKIHFTTKHVPYAYFAHRCIQSAVSLNFREGRRSYALCKLIRYSCTYEASMSPALNGSSAL